MKPIEGVLFDLDGVLLDSEGTYTTFWQAVDDRYPTGVENFAQVIKGSNLTEILHDHFPDESTRLAVRKMLEQMQSKMEFRFFDGAIAFVERLNERGIPTCIVTSSDRLKMDTLYAQHPGFTRHFRGIVTGDMVRHAKPDPECFEMGARMLDADIARCIVFEDSIKGLQAGRAAGATVIALATTLPRHELQPYADMVIDSLNRLDLDDTSLLNLVKHP